jgi:sulfur dioxygenase
LMAALHLPYPRKMDVAVPANLGCGVPAQKPAHDAPDLGWGPIVISAAGVPELEASWVAANGPRLALVDVREPAEFYGPLGHVPGAELVPLATLATSTPSLARERPLVTICRSGGRSGKAALQLSALGFRVASLRGGMVGWAEKELPIEYGRPPQRDDRQG